MLSERMTAKDLEQMLKIDVKTIYWCREDSYRTFASSRTSVPFGSKSLTGSRIITTVRAPRMATERGAGRSKY